MYSEKQKITVHLNYDLICLRRWANKRYTICSRWRICTERKQKWHINQIAIQTLTGSKPVTIKRILENYQTRLDDHNAKHELNPYDNRKPGIKIDEAINLVDLVPDGLNVV